ncbi:hypothetical protein Tco_0523646 [Tanacetum coccineum]
MWNSEDSTVTYTEVSSPFADLSDIRSPRVNGPPMMPEDLYTYVVAAFQAPPSPDYVPGPEEPEQAPPSPVYVSYVPELAYPEFMPPEEEEDDDEDLEEDLADYPTDRGDDGNDKDDKSSDDDEDDNVDVEEDDEIDPDDPPDTSLCTVQRLIRLLAALHDPAKSRGTITSHSSLPHIILSYTRDDTPLSGTPPLLPIPLPTSSPSLLLPSANHGADRPLRFCFTNSEEVNFWLWSIGTRRESSSTASARPTGGFRADYGFVATIDREIMWDLERDVSYEITDT